jgi:hypothetical protein
VQEVAPAIGNLLVSSGHPTTLLAAILGAPSLATKTALLLSQLPLGLLERSKWLRDLPVGRSEVVSKSQIKAGE